MDRIRRLPESISNQIAAGEVVERPASVVKELVENALDAGARRVQVDLEEGGQRKVQVVDDGCGMTATDARLAVERHATSKLRTVEDLFSIQTLGFRGEALPSIASVSRFELVTRTPAGDAGVRIRVEGGSVGQPEETGAPVGTQIRVEDLFFNVPARKKFLKRTSTETGHAVEAVVRLALAWRQVAFRVTSDGRSLLDVAAESPKDPKGRLARILGRGRATRLVAIPPDDRLHSVDVQGWVGEPGAAERGSRACYVFLNGRFIRDRGVQHALQEAYRGLVERSKSPPVVLFIRLDPGAFDVNVHPQKTEVRFKSPAEIHRAVVGAVGRTLQAQGWSHGPAPAAHLLRTLESAQGRAGSHGASSFSEPRHPAAAEDPAPSPRGGPQRPGPERPTEGQGRAALRAQGPMFWPRQPDGSLLLRDAPSSSLPHASPPSHPSEDPSRIASGAAAPRVRSSLLLGRYLVAESEQGLHWVDAVEATRALWVFERLQDETPVRSSSQPLLVPILLELDPGRASQLSQAASELSQTGLEVEAFGSETFRVTAIPAGLSQEGVERLVVDLLDAELEPQPDRRQAWIRAMARRAPLRPGRTVQAWQDLVDRLHQRGIQTGLDGQPVVIHVDPNALSGLFRP